MVEMIIMKWKSHIWEKDGIFKANRIVSSLKLFTEIFHNSFWKGVLWIMQDLK